MTEQQLSLAVYFRRQLIIVKGLAKYCIIFFCFFVTTTVSGDFFNINNEPERSDNKLNLSLDYKTLYGTTRPDFSGSWVLDMSASDDPKDILKEINSKKNYSYHKRNDGGSKKGSRRMEKGEGHLQRSAVNLKGNRSSKTGQENKRFFILKNCKNMNSE